MEHEIIKQAKISNGKGFQEEEKMSFAHLHLHTEYSLLDGFSKIKKVMTRAKEMGMPAVAITDHGTMFGVVEFYMAAKEAGIKPIIGLEAYLAPRDMHSHEPRDKSSTHLLLLAENQTGYQNLLEIASASQLEGFYYHPRIDHEYLRTHSEGLICTSGCMGAEIPQAIYNRDVEKARQEMEWYYDTFGRDNFFLELQDHDIPALHEINNTLLELGKEFNSQFVATNDTHYVDPGDWRYQDILLAIQTGSRLTDEKRFRMSGKTYYLRSPQEMEQLFGNIPGAIENTLKIAERCNVDLEPNGYHLPLFPVPEGEDAQSFLRKQCEKGLIWRYGEQATAPEVRERFEHELNIIHTMGFDAYFLIVQDLVNHAKENNMWYNVRGSGAGSMVAYTLGITPVEPLKFKLIFERFLNPGRISMPDIDLDIQDDKRYKLLEYCSEKYGSDRVSQIITFTTLGAKGAVRDVGRVMDVPLSEVDRVCKLIPTGTKMPQSGKPITLNNCLEEVTEFRQAVDEDSKIKDLVSTASEMEGIARNAGTHAAGVIITDIPIVKYAPLHRPTSGSDDNPIKSVAQFEMTIVDRMGLLKVDFLGLVTLTVMQKCCDMIEKRHGKKYTLYNIPTDDAATFDFLGAGNTAGVFQLESSGMTRYLMEMKPKTLEHIIAMVALYRPGPMQFIPDYIARMHGEQEVKYLHPLMEPIFAETYGIPVYQEQIMFAAMDLAGYTASEADDLRKAISKKKKDKVEKHRIKFIEGAQKKGVTQETAEKIFQEWEQFANYGFNKSHAADYGVLAVQTGWLKCHYTVEFMTAILSANASDSAKIAFYINDCRQYGIDVLPPKLATSLWDFSVEDDPNGKTHIRFGMGAVKNVGQGAAEAIIAEREANGPFQDLDDFVNRLDLRQIGRRAIESLIKVGAMDEFGERGTLLAGLDQIMSTSASKFRSKDSGQIGLFDMLDVPMAKIQLPKIPPVESREKLNWERELLGLFVSDHPLNAHLSALKRHKCLNHDQLDDVAQNQYITMGGMVQSMRNMLTKKDSRPMCAIKLEDIHGDATDVVFFPKVWELCQDIVLNDAVIMVEGRLDKTRGAPQISAMKATSLTIGGLAESEADFADSYSNEQEDEPNLHLGISENRDQDAYLTGDEADEPDSQPSEELSDDNWGVDPFFDSLESATPQTTEEISPCEPVSEPVVPAPVALPEKEDPEPAAHMTPVIPQANPPIETDVQSVSAQSALIPGKDDAVAMPASPKVEVPLEKMKFSTTTVNDALDDLDNELFSFDAKKKSRLLTLILRVEPDASAGTNSRRVKRLHGLVSSYPGNDRFAFMIFENGKVNLIEFPDIHINICDDLMDRLKKMIGESNIRIENS